MGNACPPISTFNGAIPNNVLNPYLSERVYVLPGVTADFYQLDNASDQFNVDIAKNHWTALFPNNVKLLVHKDVSVTVFEADGGWRGKTFYTKYSEPRETEVAAARATALTNLGLFAIIPPLVLLTFGWLMAWSLSGFKSDNVSKDTTSSE